MAQLVRDFRGPVQIASSLEVGSCTCIHMYCSVVHRIYIKGVLFSDMITFTCTDVFVQFFMQFVC